MPLLESVVVVDDDPAVRAPLKFALVLEELRVHLYDRPAALLPDSDLTKRACLVVDYHMRHIDGIELRQDWAGHHSLTARSAQVHALQSPPEDRAEGCSRRLTEPLTAKSRRSR